MRAAVFLALAAAVAVARHETATAQDSPRMLDTESGPVSVEVFAGGLEHPWGAALLPDGDMLVTERPGRLRLVSAEGAVGEPIEGVPDVFAQGQGGLLDVALDPDFATNRTVYLSFAEEREGGAATSVGRGRLNDDATALSDFKIIFRQEPAASGENHFGSRLAFAPDGKLFITLGERFDMQEAQDPANHLGTIVRLNPMARYRTTTPSSAARAPTRFGPTATATCRAPPSIRKPTCFGRQRWDRWGETS